MGERGANGRRPRARRLGQEPAGAGLPPERNADQPELFARYWVGLALLVGAGTMVDTPRGIAHHRAAAERGFGLAEYSLGMLYQRGHGLPRNLDSARHWLARAAAHGHPLADQAL